MASLTAIRERRRASRLEQLASAIADLLPHHPGSSVWLFGSLARGDWDGLSDVDLLAVAPDGVAARALADELLVRGLADDAIPLAASRWGQLRNGEDPYWRAIGTEAIRLGGP
jgi:predicted nucleotidyltransferase